MAELFIELFGEEIPARMQVAAENALLADTMLALSRAGLLDVDDKNVKANIKSWSGPRRLALSIKGVAARQPDLNEERRGPRADAPQKAIDGFLETAGISRDQAEVRSTPKGDFLFAVINEPGRDAGDVIPELTAKILSNFAWPKSMRWGRSNRSWVRPLHRVSVIFDGGPLAGEFDLGGGHVISFGQSTQGHHTISPEDIVLTSGDDYEVRLEERDVIVARDRREHMIAKGTEDLLSNKSLVIRQDKGLMDEVTGLVEYPHPVMGRIDDTFMELPDEILIASMRSHQKYFAVQDKEGGLAPYFVTIANMTPDPARDDTIRTGNERVLRARLADADFFWNRDKATPIDKNISRLSGITFFEKLGSMGEKAKRLAKLSGQIAKLLGATEADGKRAGELAKADLVSETVGEFPALQGIIGGHLARHLKKGKSAEIIADAITGHYKPEGPEDAVPSAPVTIAVALADKIDTLVGFFGIGKTPTGSKDPYALRRNALGVLRIIIENNLELSLTTLLEKAAKHYKYDTVPDGLLLFMQERLKVWLRDQGMPHDVVASVLPAGDEWAGDVGLIFEKAKVIDGFLQTEDGRGLMKSYRRAVNILAAEEKKDDRQYTDDVDQSFLKSSEENSLFELIYDIKDMKIHTTEEAEAYLSALGSLSGEINKFFDRNTVNDDDQKVRENRLNLLGDIRGVMGKIADFSAIES
jgi:glycyl-tRNA synthetase beta chain